MMRSPISFTLTLFLLLLLLLLSTRQVKSADDDQDTEFDPPYADMDVGGVDAGAGAGGRNGQRHHRPPLPEQQQRRVLIPLPVMPVVVVTMATPKGPDEVGALDGLSVEEEVRREHQLRQEESDQAMDQMTEEHERMLHDDTSIVGRGTGVGYYREASILEPSRQRHAVTDMDPESMSSSSLVGNKNRSLANATTSTITTQSPTINHGLLLGAGVILLICCLLMCIICAILFLIRNALRSSSQDCCCQEVCQQPQQQLMQQPMPQPQQQPQQQPMHLLLQQQQQQQPQLQLQLE